jgi:hypothetical protein
MTGIMKAGSNKSDRRRQRIPNSKTVQGMLPPYPTANIALLEWFDNSGEYGPASKISFTSFMRKDKQMIAFADDGHGLDGDSMLHMFSIDHESEAHQVHGTGKFGFGFKGAERFLIGRGAVGEHKTMVVSKKDGKFTFGNPNPDDSWSYAIVSEDEMESQELAKCRKLWKEFAPVRKSRHGTIILTNTIHTYDAKMIKELKELVAVTYGRNFGPKGIEIIINGESVEYKDIQGDDLSHHGHDDWHNIQGLYEGSGFKVGAYMHPKGSGTINSGVCVFRNQRLIVRGAKFGIPKVLGAQASMRGLQIIIECDETFDDILNVDPRKVIDKDQRIVKGFLNLLNSLGLKKVIDKVHDSGRSEKNEKNDLRHLRGVLNSICKDMRNHPNALPTTTLVPRTTNTPGAGNNPPRKPPTNSGETHSRGNQQKTGLENYKGVCNIQLIPLGEDGPWFTSDEIVPKRKGQESQLVITFNSDVDFVRDLINDKTAKGKAPQTTINYIKDAFSTEMTKLDGTFTPEELSFLDKVVRKMHVHRPHYASKSKDAKARRSGTFINDEAEKLSKQQAIESHE